MPHGILSRFIGQRIIYRPQGSYFCTKKMRLFYFLAVTFLFVRCNQAGRTAEPSEAPITDTAQYIIDKTRARHGSTLLDTSRVTFDFRGRQYLVIREGGRFQYERIWTDTAGVNTRDVWTNDGLFREINGQKTPLSAKDSSAYVNSINSVIYFALLPYALNDPGVQKKYLGLSQIKNQPFHKIGVTFRQEGGGKDFQDEYVYWIHRDSFTLDYMAYNYIVDGGGARFRQAYNPRAIQGIRFADYINFKPTSDTIRNVKSFDRLFENGLLQELSRIETENPQVE